MAVVNSTFAKEFLHPGSPLGQRFRTGTNAWMTIVGCVPDLNCDPSETRPTPVFYVPSAQQPTPSMVVLLRGAGRATDWTKTIAAEVARLQPDLPIYRVATMQELINHQIVGYYLASLVFWESAASALPLPRHGRNLWPDQACRSTSALGRLAFGWRSAPAAVELSKR